jgi:hypothetical protein
MLELLLETNNPLDIEPHELRALAEEVSGRSGISAHVAYEDQFGAGVTLHEVLYIWLPSASFVKDAIYTEILNAAFTFMRNRFRKPHGKGRPKSITVLDENGKELESFEIKTEEGEPQRHAGKGKHRRTRPPIR